MQHVYDHMESAGRCLGQLRQTPTDVADLFGYVCSDVGDVPHGHEGVKAGALLSLLDVRLVGEAEVMSDGCQEHLQTDDEVLRRPY